MLGIFFMIFCLSSDFLQNLLFQKILSGIPSVCQIAWVQIRTDFLSDLTGSKLFICIYKLLQEKAIPVFLIKLMLVLTLCMLGIFHEFFVN